MKKSLLIVTLVSLVVFAWCASTTPEYEENETTSETETLSTPEKNSVAYTSTDVALHATEDSCRSIVRGQVYDFTPRVSQHPWGSGKILAICGKDATPIFEKVHGGKEKPEMKLEDFYIGDIIVNRQ